MTAQKKIYTSYGIFYTFNHRQYVVRYPGVPFPLKLFSIDLFPVQTIHIY